MRILAIPALLAGTALAADSAASCLASAGAGYQASARVKPQSLQGDFDGDGKADIAVLVSRAGKQGVLICRGGVKPDVLGAGTPFNDMRDLDFTAWRLHSRSAKVARPKLVGDALYLEWESASAIVYWNGKRWAWYQQGD